MKKRSNFKVMLRLLSLATPLLPIMLIAITMWVIGFLCASFITIFGGYGLLNVLGISSPISIGTIFVCVLVFALVRGVLRYAEQASNHYIAFKLLAIIRDKVFKALRRLAPAKLDGRDAGNLISIITSDIELLEVFYAHTISPVAIAVIFSAIMVWFIGSYNLILGLIALLGYIIIGVVIPITASRLNTVIGAEYREQFGNMNSFFLDNMRGLKEIIQYSAGNKRLESVNSLNDKMSEKEESLKANAGKNTAVTGAMILIFSMIMLFASIALYSSGAVGFDGIIIPTIAMMSSFGPVVALANLGSTLSNTFAAGNRVLDILDENPVIQDNTAGKEITFSGAACKNIDFSYDNEKVLSDFSIEIPKNKIVGIMGKSGSGKSTLLRLLMRFWDPDNGSVLISGADVREINTSNLRDIQSFVTQQTQLFHDSIENNIKIANLNATHQQVVEACKQAAIHDFIMTLPNCYQTNVGELGDTLSGGEKQRIGVARAFLHDAPMILLDEPTSNLDSLNEAIILKSLKEQKDKTVVLVSHRESTMKIADTVCKVENGRVS